MLLPVHTSRARQQMAVSPILLGPGHILPLKADLVIEPTFPELIIYQEVRCAEEAGASCPEMLCSPSTTVLQPGSSTRTVVHRADVPLVSSTQPNQVLELPEPGSLPTLKSLASAEALEWCLNKTLLGSLRFLSQPGQLSTL